MTADLLSIACYAAATILVHDLFAALHRRLSLVAMAFSLLACAVGAIGGVLHLAALVALKGAHYFSLFTDPLQSVSLSFLQLRTQALSLALGLFAIHCLVTGYIVLRRAR